MTVAVILLYAVLSVACCAIVMLSGLGLRLRYRYGADGDPYAQHLVSRYIRVVAVVVVLATNADTLGVAEQTWRNDVVEAAYLSSQESQPPASPDDAVQEAETFQELGLPITWSDETTPDDLEGVVGKAAGLLTTFLVLSVTAPLTLRLATGQGRRRRELPGPENEY